MLNFQESKVTDTDIKGSEHIKMFTKGMIITFAFLVCFFAIPGNILSINILRRRALWISFMSVYLIWLAVLNILCLLVGMTILLIEALLNFNYEDLTKELCLGQTWVSISTMTVCNWHLVFITFGRWFYLRHASWSASRFRSCRAYMGVSLLLATVAGLQFYLLMVLYKKNSWHFNNMKGGCDLGDDFRTKLFRNSLTCFLPMFSLVIFSILIFYEVKVRSRGGSIASSNLQRSRKMVRDHNLATLLIVVNVQFIGTNLPYTVVDLIQNKEFKIIQSEALHQLALASVRVFLYGGYATNCILHCLFGSRFRNELIRYLFDKGLCPKNFRRDAAMAATRSVWTSVVDPSTKIQSCTSVTVRGTPNEENNSDVSNVQESDSNREMGIRRPFSEAKVTFSR